MVDDNDPDGGHAWTADEQQWAPSAAPATPSTPLTPTSGPTSTPSARTTAGPRRRHTPAVLAAVVSSALVVIAVVLVIDATRGDDARPITTTAPTTSAPLPSGGTATAEELASVRRLVEELNADAGGSPVAQRSVIESLVDPVHSDEQRRCPTATTTVFVEPAWEAIRRGADGHLAVPSLIKVYTRSRITGTDVALIDITTTAGQAHLPALCVA